MTVFRKRLLIGILSVVIVAGVGGLLLQKRTGESAIKQVLLISIDTCRADYLSCYGFNRPTTRNIDRLAAESVVFTHAISPAPITLPAHASMLTGTIPPYHGVRDNMDSRLGETQTTLAEILGGAGFATGAIVSSFVLNRRFGLDQGFDYYNDAFIDVGNTVGFNERRAGETTQLALQWLKEHDEGEFFLFLHYFDPHVSYDPPAPFAGEFQDNLYAGEIAYTDYCIGAVIDKLKQLGLYDSTLIVITADHGEMLGEHGEQTHAYFIYQSAVRVPLILKVPGVGARRIDDAVGLIDIVPTICAALDITPPPDVQGIDLGACFGESGTLPARQLYCESLVPTKYDAAGLYGLVDSRWKYIHTTRPELYDLSQDPLERNNLAAQLPTKRGALAAQLATMLEQVAAKQQTQGETGSDEQEVRRLESLGYVRGEVSADFQLNPAKADPKDMIKFYEAWRLLQALPVSGAAAAAGQYDREKKISRELLREMPEFFGSYLYAGKLAMLQSDFPGAAGHLVRAERLKPKQFEAVSLLAVTLVRLGELDQARHYFQQAVLLRPQDPMVRLNLGMILAKQGDLDQAIETFRGALAIDDKVAALHKSLGRALSLQGKLDEAIDHYQKSLQLDREQPEIYNVLAEANFGQGNTAAAVDNLNTALRLRPNWATAVNNLAHIKATATDPEFRDPPEAIRLAQRACRLTAFQQPRYLLTLAAAYAAAENFTEAIRTAEVALNITRAAGRGEQAADIETRLKLYRSGLRSERVGNKLSTLRD